MSVDLRQTPKTEDNVTRVSVEKPEGTRKTFVSPDWGDCTTWYWKSTKLDGYQLDAYDDGYTIYQGYGCWIDNFHGKYFDEDVLTNEAGDIPRLKIYVDGYEKIEQDPQYLISADLSLKGDYVVDYKNAKVTFHDALLAGSVVTGDIWIHTTSEWIIKPDSGKKLKLETAEVQFSKNISLKDKVNFQVWVYNPYDLPNKVPYGNPAVYKTMKDFINEANGALPSIPATANINKTWRDLEDDVVTYPWNYQAVTELKSSVGAEIRISLAHNEVFDGFATATFYCRVFDDV
jgi:hypothetical protein